MDIHEAAKRLRALGIPGKEKEKALKEKLVHKDSAHIRKAVEKYIEKTLIRWAYFDEVICKPERHEQGKGRGKTSDWPDEVVEEAAAVWAVRNCDIVKKNALSPKTIPEIKRIAQRAFASPDAIHVLPGDVVLTTPNPSSVYDFSTLETRLDKDKGLNTLIVKWIAAKVRVRNNEKAGEEAERIKKIEDAQPEWVRERERVMKEMGAVSNPRYRFFTMHDSVRVIIRWHSMLLRTKNPALKDVQTDEYDRTLEKEGLLADVPPPDFELRHIPHTFHKGVSEGFQRDWCRIPLDSPTMKSFWDRFEELERPDRQGQHMTYAEIDRLINEITKDWRYIPLGWTFKFSRVELEPSDHDDLVIFLDGNDSRKKAIYAPFNKYNPHDTYDRDHIGVFY
jgi:hypothetical protein